MFEFDFCPESGSDVLNFSYVYGTQVSGALISTDERPKYVKMAAEKQLSDHSGLWAVLRKGNAESELRPPVQGYCDNAPPREFARA